MTTAQYLALSFGLPVAYTAVSLTAYMLLSRDLITQFIWSKYPPSLMKFFSCAACSGTWYGLGLAANAWLSELPFFGLRGDWWFTPLAIAAWTRWTTPIAAKWHIDALLYTSDEPAEQEVPDAQDSTA